MTEETVMGESRPRLRLLDLNSDVFTMILELISTSADLGALCSTSQAVHKLVVPYLYRRIEINGPTRLLSCTYARKHFKHTTSLTVLDTPEAILPRVPFETSMEVEGGLVQCATPGNHGRERKDTDSDQPIDATMLSEFLRLFREAKLSTFRFTSKAAGLDAGCWRELANHFDTLKHLHANLDSWPKSELPRLETIDIRTYGSSKSFPSKSDFELFLRKEFSKRNSSVKRLHLELAPRYHHVSHVNNHFRQVDVFPELFLSHKISLAHLENLTCLSLCRLPLVHPADVEFPSSWLPDIQHLKKLTLLRCYGAREFLVAFGNACAASQSPLEHLQAEIEWRTGEITSQDVDPCLEPIYRSCGRLKSLHVGWCVPPGEPERLPGITLAYLQHGGHLLRSFSLHNHTWDHTSEGYGRFEPIFREPQILLHAFRNCPNLEELAFVTSDSLATDDSKSAWEHWKKVRQGFEHLPKLRILHLRQQTRLIHAFGRQYRSEHPVGHYILEFVNELFTYLDQTGFCPLLRYVVWGCESKYSSPQRQELVAQHCYVRRRVKNSVCGGSDVSIGNLTSQREVKLHDPDLELLQLDPAHYMADKSPGRFYDD